MLGAGPSSGAAMAAVDPTELEPSSPKRKHEAWICPPPNSTSPDGGGNCQGCWHLLLGPEDSGS